MVDKDEVAISLNITVKVLEEVAAELDNRISNRPFIVSKPHMESAAPKVLQLPDLQGLGCAKCPKCKY